MSTYADEQEKRMIESDDVLEYRPLTTCQHEGMRKPCIFGCDDEERLLDDVDQVLADIAADEVDERQRMLDEEFETEWVNFWMYGTHDDAKHWFLRGVALGDRLGRRAEAVELSETIAMMIRERGLRR